MWLPEIDKELNDTDFGIVCVTKQNVDAKWLNFEAGALSRKVGAKRELMPVLLIDFDTTGDVEGPITGFQMKMANREDFFDIMKDLNAADLGPKIKEEILRSRVDAAWPAIELEVEKVRSAAASIGVDKRDDDDKLEEILETVRGIAAATAVGAGQRKESRGPLANVDLNIVARAIARVGRSAGVGEMSVEFPDRKRILVSTERPIHDAVAKEIQTAVEGLLEQAIEIAYNPMSPEDLERLRDLLASRPPLEEA